MRIEATESETQTAIMHLLAAEQIFALRINTSSQVLTDANGRKRVLKSHSGGAGVADILATPRYLRIPGEGVYIDGPPCLLWIEVKSPRGKQSPEQMLFQKQAEEFGHYYLLARSATDVMQWLKEHR